MASKAHHKCIVSGEYIKKEAGGKTLANYELEFKVPDLGEDKTDTHYMSVIKRELLTPALKAKYPGVVTYRTHEMVDRTFVAASGTPAPQTQTPQAPTKQVSSMNKTELTDYIQAHEYNIDLEIYSTVDKMRKAIKAYEENKDAFVQEQADLKAEIELKNTLSDLNPLPTPANSNEETGEGEVDGDNAEG